MGLFAVAGETLVPIGCFDGAGRRWVTGRACAALPPPGSAALSSGETLDLGALVEAPAPVVACSDGAQRAFASRGAHPKADTLATWSSSQPIALDAIDPSRQGEWTRDEEASLRAAVLTIATDATSGLLVWQAFAADLDVDGEPERVFAVVAQRPYESNVPSDASGASAEYLESQRAAEAEAHAVNALVVLRKGVAATLVMPRVTRLVGTMALPGERKRALIYRTISGGPASPIPTFGLLVLDAGRLVERAHACVPR